MARVTLSRGGEDAVIDDSRLAELIEHALANRGGEAVGVASVSRRPSRFAIRSSAEEVTVELADGSSMALFAKQIAPEGADHPDKVRRDREPLVYRHLLEGHELPVPALLASTRDERSETVHLVLEHIDGWSLKYRELDHWHTAARRLGELHAHFGSRADELMRCDFLLRLDRDYFTAWAERALAAVEETTSLGRRLGRALRDHARVIDLLAARPQTLVHNDLAPKNVLVDTASDPAAIYFVDWELAGVGCGLLDLVHLMHGLPPEEERRMCSAYRTGLAGSPPSRPDRTPNRVLAACALQNTVYRLAHIGEWGVADSTVAAWIDEVEHLSDDIRR